MPRAEREAAQPRVRRHRRRCSVRHRGVLGGPPGGSGRSRRRGMIGSQRGRSWTSSGCATAQLFRVRDRGEAFSLLAKVAPRWRTIPGYTASSSSRQPVPSSCRRTRRAGSAPKSCPRRTRPRLGQPTTRRGLIATDSGSSARWNSRHACWRKCGLGRGTPCKTSYSCTYSSANPLLQSPYRGNDPHCGQGTRRCQIAGLALSM
jgi:hypothetical protein